MMSKRSQRHGRACKAVLHAARVFHGSHLPMKASGRGTLRCGVGHPFSLRMRFPVVRFTLAVVTCATLALPAPSAAQRLADSQGIGAPAAPALPSSPLPSAPTLRKRPRSAGSEPLRPPVPRQPAARPQRTRYVLVGTAVGAGLGLAVGLVARRNASNCNGCVPPVSFIPVAGTIVGAAVGSLGGLLVHAGRGTDGRRDTTSIARE